MFFFAVESIFELTTGMRSNIRKPATSQQIEYWKKRLTKVSVLAPKWVTTLYGGQNNLCLSGRLLVKILLGDDLFSP